jgi:DNA-binding transcriptional LysR family regulator
MHQSEGGEPARDREPETNALTTLAPVLVALAALGRDANVTRAAAASGISQPALSRAVSRWERALGVDLVEHVGRDVKLTAAGSLLAQAATQALGPLEEAVAVIGEAGADAPLRLGFLSSVGPTIVGELVTSFRRANSTLRVQHHEGPTVELLDALVRGEIDIAIVAPRPSSNFGWLPVGRQSLVLTLPANHPRAGDERVSLRDFADADFLALDQRFSTRHDADALMAEAGITPRIVMEGDNARTVRDWVAGGHGVAILPSDGSMNPRVRTVTIDSELATRDIGLAWYTHRHAGGAAVSFRAHVLQLNEQYPSWADLLD